jgi:hypothetical protein
MLIQPATRLIGQLDGFLKQIMELPATPEVAGRFSTAKGTSDPVRTCVDYAVQAQANRT